MSASTRPERHAFRAAYAPPDEGIAARLLSATKRRRQSGRAHRRPRLPAGRSDPRQGWRSWRGRGLSPRLLAFHQGRPRPDGAGRGVAARPGCCDGGPADRGQACRRRLGSRGAFIVVSGFRLRMDARHHRAGHPARRDAGEHRREHGQAARLADRAAGDAAGDEAARLPFCPRARHRGGAVARRLASRVPLFVRHAGRGCAHRRRRETLFRGLCRCDRRNRQARRQRRAAGAARHFGQAVGAAPPLRGGVARSRVCGAGAAYAGAGAPGQAPRPQLHGRCGRSGPARAVAAR